MEILPTIEINDRNRSDFERMRNLDEYRTDEYTTEDVYIPACEKSKPVDCLCFEECNRTIAEFCCPKCGEMNRYVGELFDGYLGRECTHCRANLEISIDFVAETVTVRIERPLG